MKKALVEKTGLEASELKILFRGVEKDDAEQLQAAGVKDGSKVVLVEDPNKRVEQVEQQPPLISEEMAKALAAVNAVTGEVDKLSDRVRVRAASFGCYCRRGEKREDCALS